MHRPQQLARHQNQQIQNEIVHVTTKAQFIIKTNKEKKDIKLVTLLNYFFLSFFLF